MKGLFIPGITAKMFRDASLESVAELMAEGTVYDIDYKDKSDSMTRKEEVKGSVKYLNHLIDVAAKEKLSQEQITNVNLSVISHQITDISVTLAIIADKLGGE